MIHIGYVILFVNTFYLFFLYSLNRNEHETIIGTTQWTSIKNPIRILPISAPTLPNIVPIDVVIPLNIKTHCQYLVNE